MKNYNKQRDQKLRIFGQINNAIRQLNLNFNKEVDMKQINFNDNIELLQKGRHNCISNNILEMLYRTRKADLKALIAEDMMYYPAAGTDIQVLLRFSHMITHIVAPNLSRILDTEEISRRFRIKCNTLNMYYNKELLTYDGFFKLDSSHFNEYMDYDLLDINKVIRPKKEREQYFKAFKDFYKQELTAHAHVFTRHYNNYSKKLVWISLNTEGLATLLILRKLLGKSPKIITTIQTGVMEEPRGLLFDIMTRYDINPVIWVRGIWTPFPEFRYGGCRKAIWTRLAQRYNYWYSPLGAEDDSGEENYFSSGLSEVRAYTKKLPYNEQYTYEHRNNPDRSIKLFVKKLDAESAKSFDVVFAPEWIAEKIDNAQSWESISDRSSELFPSMLFGEILDYIRDYSKANKNKKIAIVPTGYEDEISMIPHFVEMENDNLDLSIFVENYMDANTGANIWE